MGPSRTLVSRFFPPKSEPSAPGLVPDLTLSASGPVLGEAERRVGLKASFSLPTGDTPGLLGAVSTVLACVAGTSWADVSESAGAASAVVAAESSESIVSEVIKGEERVSSPACDYFH